MMEIRPILSAMMRNKTGPLLVVGAWDPKVLEQCKENSTAQKAAGKLVVKVTNDSTSLEFTLANGEHLRLRVGNANFEYQQKIRAAPVVFGKSGVYLLGVTTLEALGLLLDPIRRELRPVPMVLMPALRSTGTIAMANRVVVNTNRKNRNRRQAHARSRNRREDGHGKAHSCHQQAAWHRTCRNNSKGVPPKKS